MSDERTSSGIEVSVIVPHYNDLQNLERCLTLLSAQSMPGDRFEVVVADNNSRCGLAAVEALCEGRARVVPAYEQGAGCARNAAVAASRGHYLAFIDSDCRPRADWIERGVAALEGAELVGGRVLVDPRVPGRPNGVEAFEQVFSFNFERYIREEGFAGTGNMFVRRVLFDKVGPFRAGIAEDKEWGQRATAMGHRWSYAPDVIVSHPARHSWEELKAKWRKVIAEAYPLALERDHGRIRWYAHAWAVLLSPIIHLPRVMLTPNLERVSDRLKAAAILFRIRAWRFMESHRIDFRHRTRTEGRPHVGR